MALPFRIKRRSSNDSNNFSIVDFIQSHIIISSAVVVLLIGAIVFAIVSFVSKNSNPFINMHSSIMQNIDSGSFSFTATADFNGERYMSYDGKIEITPDNQSISMIYDAEYTEYSYTNVCYSKNGEYYNGNFFSGQWTVTDSKDRVVDVFELIRSAKSQKGWASPLLRIVGLSSLISSETFEESFDDISADMLSDPETLNYTKTDNDSSVTHTFSPNLAAVSDILVKDAGPTFMHASDFNDFCDKVKANKEVLENSTCTFGYTVDNNGYMTDLFLTIETGDKKYDVNITMSEFSNTKVEIPEDFFTAASIDLDDKK